MGVISLKKRPLIACTGIPADLAADRILNGGKGFGQMAKMLGGGDMDMAKLAKMAGQPEPTPQQMEEMAEKLKGLGGPGGGFKLPGLGGGGLPPGFNPFKK